MNITDNQKEYVESAVARLKAQGMRVISDVRNEKVGFKIREHTLQKIPYLLVVGDKEVETGTVSVRTQQGEDLGGMTVDAVMNIIIQQQKDHSH